MTPIAYTPTDEQLRLIADEITAEARYRADDAESNGYDSYSTAEGYAEVETAEASYWVEFCMKVWMRDNWAADVFECGAPWQTPVSIMVEVTSLDAMVNDNEIDIDEPSKDAIIARLNDMFDNKLIKAA